MYSTFARRNINNNCVLLSLPKFDRFSLLCCVDIGKQNLSNRNKSCWINQNISHCSLIHSIMGYSSHQTFCWNITITRLSQRRFSYILMCLPCPLNTTNGDNTLHSAILLTGQCTVSHLEQSSLYHTDLKASNRQDPFDCYAFSPETVVQRCSVKKAFLEIS